MADVSSTLTSLYSSSSLLGASSSALNQSANGSGSSSRSASATTPAGSSYCSWVCTSANSSATESTTTAGSASILADPYANFYIGVILGILQTVLNGFSFLFNKKAQQRLIARGYAATNSIRYLCDWMWWLAMVLLVGAEAMNFVAYIFAPATVVAPLGALQIVTCAILAWIFLKEHLNVFGQVGCVLTIIGTTLIVIFAPEAGSLTNIWELWLAFLHPAWLSYLGVVIVINLFLIIFANPRWGKKIVFIPVTITASIGSITVMTAKGLGVGLSELFKSDLFPLKFWFTYVILAVGAASVVLQIVYLNIAISQYNINMVAPILYVEFTSLTIAAGGILLEELNNLEYQAIIALALGFAVIVVGLFLIASFKDLKFGWRDWFFFMFKRKQVEKAIAEEEAAKGDQQQLGESAVSTPGSDGAAAGLTEPQTAGGEATTNAAPGDETDGHVVPNQEGVDGDLASPKTGDGIGSAGTEVLDSSGSSSSPATPTAAAISSSSSANATATAPELATDSPTSSETGQNLKKGKKSFFDIFKRKKEKTGEKATTSASLGGEEKDTLKEALKKRWYQITDLNAFGSRGKHKLLHSQKSGSQASLPGSAPNTTTLSTAADASGSGSVPEVAVNGAYENAAADLSELPDTNATHLHTNDGEPDDAGGDQLYASSRSVKLLLGGDLNPQEQQRRGSGSSDGGHLEGSVLICELPLRPPPLYTIDGAIDAGAGYDLPTPRANANPFAPNAQTPRSSHSSGSTPRVELQMIGVTAAGSLAAPSSPKPVYSNVLDVASLQSRINDRASPSRSSPIGLPAVASSSTPPPPFPIAAVVGRSPAFTRSPSLGGSEASYSLDALAGAGDDRYRSRLPSDTSSVVTVRAAVPMAAVSPLAASGHVAANSFLPPPPRVPVTTGAGQVDYV